jgi:hypothetical protein
MIAAVEAYLAVRRLGGFALSNTEYLLRSFSAYAGAHGEAVIRTATVITWATQGPSLAQRHRRNPVLRLPGPALSHRGPTTLPARARRESPTGPRGLGRRHADARGLASVSPLRWGHGRRRTTHRTPNRPPGLPQRTCA